MNTDEEYMQRALQLAEYGRGSVSPNPMVGCVLVADGRIIGEGWHRNYGGPHAEVHAVRDAIARGHEALFPLTTAYVTLEPCSHYGKTPPCAALLVHQKITRVVVANDDPNPLVAGRGLTLLRDAGIQVERGLLAEMGQKLNRRFFTFFTKKRPYIILKWAESADGFIAAAGGKPVPISNKYSTQLVHRWRGEEDAILVGRQTTLSDNPSLNVRHWPGTNPVRVVLDRRLSLPQSLRIFDASQPTILYNYLKRTDPPTLPERYSNNFEVAFSQIKPGNDELDQVLSDLYARKIQSVLVEGGTTILEAFVKAGLWDEIRRCQGPMRLGSGVKAPAVGGTLVGSENIDDDLWTFYQR
ncbi:bifunctional diaminohydroxyphosphoribosylaminopyrimidine deaminase/5-amino-6-(5-phosphoribosylamino)uracil reductase RibD [Salmonirosea aquatica]|uniref:Riboflavin biosynthesis protein RibD n=1 Tax=Salmonirosea aquatica TaxID=2654236 RepID=A0A7C9FC18_9BACT|nr:bifunctional diaminohydroxyphosphoribosylaminopyrimidine deaminase/5-amino-6-(5-phosphoribosylamino)uracil reductase RibD [Cytophagaceae bacterium SJW1-29]